MGLVASATLFACFSLSGSEVWSNEPLQSRSALNRQLVPENEEDLTFGQATVGAGTIAITCSGASRAASAFIAHVGQLRRVGPLGWDEMRCPLSLYGELICIANDFAHPVTCRQSQ